MLVVLEASGGYEHTVMAALTAAGQLAALVNPRRVRDFARSTGAVAKTDRLDAHTLARFAQAVRPPTRPAPSAATQALAATLARRRQLLEMLTAEQNRLRTPNDSVRDQLVAHVAWLKAALKDIDCDLERQIGADPRWQERARLVRSVPGVGRVLSTTLLADLPELGRLNRRH